MNKEINFIREKVAVSTKISEVFANEMVLSAGREYDDFMRDEFTVKLEAFILTHVNEIQRITVYRERPTFLDWLFRRKREFTFEINCKDVLINPPTLPPGKSQLMYVIKEVE